jgi:nucleoside-diphosphate-sugar epimerase
LKKILITGANGFVGKALSTKLELDESIYLLRTSRVECDDGCLPIDFSCDFELKNELEKVNAIIHCAARVHVICENSCDTLQAFRKVNTLGAIRLAQQAAIAGVERFIFLSSIKVNGESTKVGFPFKPDDNHIPTDPYGLSKYEAEVGLRKIAEETGMEVVIIRPPLVYGAGVKANFASMMKWVYKGIPLPLGGVNANKRSLVAVDNLVDLIVTCIGHPKAADQTFLVSDDDDVSTTDLLKNMAQALGVKSKLLPFPPSWFVLVAKLIARPAISDRLCGSLQVDISKTKEMLDWKPPYSVTECMKKTANAFLENNNK